jgi:tRNA(Ile)-lysidine synthase
MFQPGDSVLVAVSGGPDSVALAALLHQLAPRLSITLGIAHLNHGLRPEADREARFVETLAQQLALPFHLESQDVADYRDKHGLSLEEAARDVRYAFYRKVARIGNYRKVALGHHRDDNAEMVLMNLLRGAGPLGLSGIPPVRENWIVRPLINLSRSHIRAYLEQRQLDYVNDPSNADLRFTRNRIRHLLLPQIKKAFNPNIVDTLHRTATISGDEDAWIESVVDPLFEAALVRRAERQLSLDVTAVARMPKAAARRILRRAIKLLRGNLRRISLAHVDTLIQLTEAGENARADLPGLITAVRQTDQLVLQMMEGPRQPMPRQHPGAPYAYWIESRQLSGSESFRVPLAVTGGQVIFRCRPAADIPEIRGSGQYTALFDIDQLTFPLLLRNYQPGDRYTPLGMCGTKKVKKLFNERKLPPAARASCPVLISGADLLWVLGHQRAEAGRLNRQTRRVLEAKYVLPDEK